MTDCHRYLEFKEHSFATFCFWINFGQLIGCQVLCFGIFWGVFWSVTRLPGFVLWDIFQSVTRWGAGSAVMADCGLSAERYPRRPADICPIKRGAFEDSPRIYHQVPQKTTQKYLST